MGCWHPPRRSCGCRARLHTRLSRSRVSDPVLVPVPSRSSRTTCVPCGPGLDTLGRSIAGVEQGGWSSDGWTCSFWRFPGRKDPEPKSPAMPCPWDTSALAPAGWVQDSCGSGLCSRGCRVSSPALAQASQPACPFFGALGPPPTPPLQVVPHLVLAPLECPEIKSPCPQICTAGFLDPRWDPRCPYSALHRDRGRPGWAQARGGTHRDPCKLPLSLYPQIYYKVIKDIGPGEELLVHVKDSACALGAVPPSPDGKASLSPPCSWQAQTSSLWARVPPHPTGHQGVT